MPDKRTNPTGQVNRKNSRVWLSIALGIVVAASALAFVYLRHPRQQKEPDGNQITAVMHLETFVMNTADTDQSAYLRVGIDLGLERRPEKVNAEGSDLPTAQVRDTVVGILTATRAQDVTTPEGKAKLKQELLRALQSRVPTLGIREIYFTEFLIQS